MPSKNGSANYAALPAVCPLPIARPAAGAVSPQFLPPIPVSQPGRERGTEAGPGLESGEVSGQLLLGQRPARDGGSVQPGCRRGREAEEERGLHTSLLVANEGRGGSRAVLKEWEEGPGWQAVLTEQR